MRTPALAAPQTSWRCFGVEGRYIPWRTPVTREMAGECSTGLRRGRLASDLYASPPKEASEWADRCEDVSVTARCNRRMRCALVACVLSVATVVAAGGAAAADGIRQ